MASKHKQHELLRKGIVSNSISREGFAKNVFFKNDVLEVRQGFGQLAEFDSSFGHNFEDADASTQQVFEWNYRKHLGSYIMLTDFGHVQIISAFLTRVNTSNETINGMSANICVINIYDVTINDRWEAPVYRHTSANSRERIDMPRWQPIYQSCIDQDFQDWIQITGDDEFFFVEYRDILFLGSKEAGLLVYFPAIFNGNKTKQIDKTVEKDNSPVDGESSLLIRAVPSAGAFVEGVTYLNRSELPNPAAAVVVGNRMVYARGRTIYFSEPGNPTNIRADNTVELSDIESEITALATLMGNVYIFTDRESWVYHPNDGADVVSLGILNPLSRSIGCSGKNALCYRGNKIVWMDSNGTYATAGNYVIETISRDIDDFFTRRGLADPTTNYFTESGHTYTNDPQPKTFYHFDPDRVNLTYWHNQGLLLASIPGENCTLVLCDNNEWTLWTYESIVYARDPGPIPEVKAVKNIESAWLLPYQGDCYLVGGDLTNGQVMTDNSTRIGQPKEDDHLTSFSYYILQYARGGALDRNSFFEDFRTFGRKAELQVSDGIDRAVCYVDPWIRMRKGDRVDYQTTITTLNDTDVWLLPISIVPVPSIGGGVSSITIRIQFDKAYWKPFLVNTNELRYILPPERLGSNPGWSPGAPIPGTSQIQLCNLADIPDAAGEVITLRWNSAQNGGNLMQLVADQKNPIIYIPMQSVTGNVAVELAGMGLKFTPAGWFKLNAVNGRVCTYNRWTVPALSYHIVNLKAQAVDWAYKTINLTPEDGMMVRAHGLDLYFKSQGKGKATEQLEQSWVDGILNVITDSDGAMTRAQRVDFWEDARSGKEPSVARNASDKETIKESYKDTLNSANVYKPLFEDPNIVWSDETDPNDVNYLIEDDVVSRISTSDNIRGRRVSYLIYGFMQHECNRLVFENIKGRFSADVIGSHVRHSSDGG